MPNKKIQELHGPNLNKYQPLEKWTEIRKLKKKEFKYLVINKKLRSFEISWSYPNIIFLILVIKLCQTPINEP